MTFEWPKNPRDVRVTNPSENIPDGAANFYRDPNIAGSPYFDNDRIVIFVNGMGNTPADHANSAVALSELQMCLVIGVYNLSKGFWRDFGQCIADKNQFNGPVSRSARLRVDMGSLFNGGMQKTVALEALGRNPPQQTLFNVLESAPSNKTVEIFAHSQGNLILSNVMQALAAVYGTGFLGRFVVHTFGSPAVNWPMALTIYRNAYTFDPVSWLAGAEENISKVGLPSGSYNPFTHGFAEYVKLDPIFVVNRYRTGGWRMTFDMDEEGLASALVGMGTNFERIFRVFTRLKEAHASDSDDVAELYIDKIRGNARILSALGLHTGLRKLLINILDKGWTSGNEYAAIDLLKGLKPPLQP